jgi:hypothetical protein
MAAPLEPPPAGEPVPPDGERPRLARQIGASEASPSAPVGGYSSRVGA